MLQDLARKGHQSATCSHLHHTEGKSHRWQHCQDVREHYASRLFSTLLGVTDDRIVQAATQRLSSKLCWLQGPSSFGVQNAGQGAN